jgi:acyl carrier protein
MPGLVPPWLAGTSPMWRGLAVWVEGGLPSLDLYQDDLIEKFYQFRMDSVVDNARSSGGSQDVRERNLITIVGELARELHPQHVRPDTISLSSRLERDLGIDSLGRTELVLRLERIFRSFYCSDRHRNARMADFVRDFAMACGEMGEAQFTLV